MKYGHGAGGHFIRQPCRWCNTYGHGSNRCKSGRAKVHRMRQRKLRRDVKAKILLESYLRSIHLEG